MKLTNITSLFLLLVFTTAQRNVPVAKITVDTHTKYQVIDGFGASLAFQRTRQIQKLSNSTQQQTLDYLFSDTKGAGLTIIRNGVGSSKTYDLDWMKSIAPNSPGSSDSTPVFEWDGDDAGQVWVTKEAIKRGLKKVYASAWSAPAYMKSNGKDTDGGNICGVLGTNCTTGDWRKAYAEYLVQYLRFYQEKEDINITHVGFINEPDLNQTYASMLSSGFQAADFLQVLRPAIRNWGNSVKIVCCEATGWGDGEDFLSELQSVPKAEDDYDVYSAHGYSVHPSLPFNTDKRVWQTEWADLTGRWRAEWDALGKEGEGMAWANKIHSALALSNVSAFFYWEGAQETTTNESLIRLLNGTAIPSGRLWALAHYSRHVRPDALRVDAKSDLGYVKVSAFENVDGKIAIHVINNGHKKVSLEISLSGVNGTSGNITTWVTNEKATLERGSVSLSLGKLDGIFFNAMIDERTFTSFTL